MGGRKGKNEGDGGGGYRLVSAGVAPSWMLIFSCTIKSRSSLLAPAHPGGLLKRVVKRMCVCACVYGKAESQNNLSLT